MIGRPVIGMVADIDYPHPDYGRAACGWCGAAIESCDGSCADLTPAELAYTDRLIATGVIRLPGRLAGPCPHDTDGDGNCAYHSDCSTLRPWAPGERRSERLAR